MLFLLCCGWVGPARGTTDIFTASGSWTAPAGVTSATVETWGGGGGGGGATGNPAKGGGGAGGQYAKKVVTVVPGVSYPVVVGGGGGEGAVGGDSKFNTTTVVAKGGAAGATGGTNNGTALGGVGSTSGGVGDVVHAGGSGSNGVGNTGVGGAGGGGAGSSGAGGSASGNTAGTGTASGGGNGAAARTRGGSCSNSAAVAGGGGCGGYATGPADRSGGSGAAGKVSITYTATPAPSATTQAATGVTAWVATLNGTVSSNGFATTVSFEYGLSTAYGFSIMASQSPLAAGAANSAVSAALEGAGCGTTFHYRVVATSVNGTTYGADATFTTLACSAPYPATACAATRFGGNLGCSANDVNLTAISLAPGSISSCVSGAPVTLDLDLIVNFASPDRWDVGIFIANDGKLPTLLPTSGGASSCSVDILPITPPASGYTFPSLDGGATGDTCGDGNSAINGGTGSGVKRMTGVTLPCYASPASGGKLFVPFTVSWDNQKSPIGGLCTSSLYPVPNTTSKCNAPLSTVAIEVVVLPVITKTNGVSQLSPGNNTTYTVTVFNNSGGTLQDSVFKDPAVTYLTVNGVSCVAAGGATCPGGITVAQMQGAGIAIPSASLPNNGSLVFTVEATVSSAAPITSPATTLSNTATVFIGSSSTSATDTDNIVIAPSAAMAFSPASITEGAVSVMTITLTNPLGTAVTGVSFTDNYPALLTNAGSAGATTTCGGTVTAVDNGNSLSLSGGTIPAGGSCTVTVNVTSGTAGSYTSSTGNIATSGDPIAPVSAILTVTTPVFGSFNACDVAVAPNAVCTATTTATNSRIRTKVAGSPFSLDIVALKVDGSRNTSYNSTVKIELLDASDNSGTLDSRNCRSTWSVIATLSPNPAFSGANNGLITVGTFTVPEAYRDVRVRISNVGGSSRIGCSTDNFAIRPNDFRLSPTDLNWTSAGTDRALGNTDIATGTVVHKAGQPFTLGATARNALATPTATTLYAGTPTASLTQCAGTACTAGFGTLSLGALAFSSGAYTTASASYSEVGSFKLTLMDSSFTSVDAPDTAADCTASGRYICGSTSVGRFVPDHFEISGGAIVNRSDVNAGIGCLPASTFTYMGEPMKASFSLTARNAGGTTTQNYAGGFAKFTNAPGNWLAASGSDHVGLWMTGQHFAYGGGTCNVYFDNASPYDTTFNCTVGNPSAVGSSVPRVSVSSPSITWTAGLGSFSVQAVLLRGSTPDGSYPSVVLGVAPVDGDGVGVAAAALNLDANGDSSNERASLATTAIRYGRLRLLNAYGSELLDLRVPVRAEYYDSGSWRVNADDACTTIANPRNSIAIGNYSAGGGLTDANMGASHLPTAALTLQSGQATLMLAKPSANTVRGSFDLALNLGSAVGLQSCVPALTATTTEGAMDWLTYAWCPGITDPMARGTLGSAKSPFIYLRERY